MAGLTGASNRRLGAITSSAEGDVEAAPIVAAPPGPTIDALNAGSTQGKWIVAIEGYPSILTDATEEQALEAWDGFDWATAIPGICVEHESSERLDPWQPFHGGGSLTIFVPPGSDRQFLIDTHRQNSGDETVLEATVDRDDTTLTVKSTSLFAASGEVNLGTEAIAYSGKTGTTFTGCTRGKYAPFAVDGGTRFSQNHTVTTDPNALKLKPKATEHPRKWISRWVGLWRHLYDHENGLLNTRDDARLVFAGRVAEVRDDPGTMNVAVEVENVLDYVKRALIGKDLWSAKIKDGMFLETGMTFDMEDSDNASTTWRTANSLVVTTGASGVNEIEEGFYEASEIHSKVTDWLAAELAASRLFGSYSMGITPDGGSGLRTRFSWRIPGAGPSVHARFYFPIPVNRFFGDFQVTLAGSDRVRLLLTGQDGVDLEELSENVPLRTMITPNMFTGPGSDPRLGYTEERGTFIEQYDFLPETVKPPNAGEWGVFLIDDSYLFLAEKFGDELIHVGHFPPAFNLAGAKPLTEDAIQGFGRSMDDDSTISVRQILMYESTFGEMLKLLFYSTGTLGYNHATYDVLPASIGLGIPAELLGDNFEASVDNMPGASSPLVMVLDEPKSIEKLFKGSLIFRSFSFLRWKDEGLQFFGFRTPTPDGTVLTEANKASPVGTDDNHRSSTILTADWQYTTIVVDFDRDITNVSKDGGFRSHITFVDPGAESDAGGDARGIGLQLVDTFGESGVQALAGQFKAAAPLFTHEARKTSRTMDSRFFESIAVGDCVLVTDEFAADPDTGDRGVAARPGIVIMHRWSLGGPLPGGDKPADVLGELEIMLIDRLRIAPYVPTAQLDETSTNSGYVVATKTITCHAHKFSEATEPADASHFPAPRKVRLIEMDPPDPASPSTHDDTVASQTGDTIVITTGFAGFDSTKRYIVVFDTFADATADQQAFSYQADDADGLIADLRLPFEYANGFPLTSGHTVNDAADPVTLPANNTFGDGVGRDVGTESATLRLINNLEDYKTARSAPMLYSAELSGGVAVAWKFVAYRHIHLTTEKLNATARRALSVAPWMKSSDGASASVRVTLSRARPGGTSVNNINRGAVISEATFTSTSTTYAQATAQDLDIRNVKGAAGLCYLVIECSEKARTFGLSRVQEGPRVT